MTNLSKYGMSLKIGETASGISSPVFFDPHYPLRVNNPPVTLITGGPGSGKTMASALMAGQSSVLGKTTIIIDPKGDFLALKKLEEYGELSDVNIWSIFNDPEEQVVDRRNIGALDPTRLTNNKKVNASLTLFAVETLAKTVSTEQRNSLIPLIQDITEGKNPSLDMVKTMLARHPEGYMRALSKELGVSLSLPEGRLLTSPPERPYKVNLSTGTTVISLMGLTLPSMNKKEDKYSENERVSVVIMRMITHLILDIMKSLPKLVNKTLIIDEAWAVFRSEAGKGLIEEVALLGRSMNMATILATQSPSHIKDTKDKDDKKNEESSIENTISTRFAFRTKSESESLNLVKSFKMPENEGYDEIFSALKQGMCAMSDVLDQTALVQIVLPDLWLQVLDTTPDVASDE